MSGVYLGNEKIGGNYLQLDGEDRNCDKMSTIIDAVSVPENVQADTISSGELTVRITTSAAVDCCPCQGSILYAHICLSWLAQVTSNEINANYVPQPPSAWDVFQHFPENMVLQYSIGSLSAPAARFRVLPPHAAVVSGFSASVSPHELLAAHAADDKVAADGPTLNNEPAVIHFRLSMTVGDLQLHG